MLKTICLLVRLFLTSFFKAFNYRMHPDNLQILKEANIDYVSLANNHTLDFSEKGMVDTMQQLDRFGIKWAGVGMNKRQAERPAVLDFNGRRILVFRLLFLCLNTCLFGLFCVLITWSLV